MRQTPVNPVLQRAARRIVAEFLARAGVRSLLQEFATNPPRNPAQAFEATFFRTLRAQAAARLRRLADKIEGQS